ncbi:hypothetical protein [Streptomyces sp. NPDC003554]
MRTGSRSVVSDDVSASIRSWGRSPVENRSSLWKQNGDHLVARQALRSGFWWISYQPGEATVVTEGPGVTLAPKKKSPAVVVVPLASPFSSSHLVTVNPISAAVTPDTCCRRRRRR